MKTIQSLLIFLLCPLLLTAQEFAPSLTAKEQKQVLDSVITKLQSTYVFPEVAAQMIKQLKKGKYTDIKDPIAFADQLTTDLFSVSHDKHLGIRYDPRWVAEYIATKDSAPQLFDRAQNFGFREVKILEGNIGYLDLRGFADTSKASKTIAVAAMNFLSNTDAIIIDLRYNGGGATDMVQLLASYLFNDTPQPLTDVYWRPTDKLTTWKTLPKVEGKRMPGTDVYVLTSKRTFSAAEDFCYSLQNLKRITIVGETTGGGAHPVEIIPLSDKFFISIPAGRSISVITKTDWEGTGVKPDIAVNAKDALSAAQQKALEKMLVKRPGDYQLEWALNGAKQSNLPVATLTIYAGSYGDRAVILENGNLYYQRKGDDSKYHMIPLTDNLFKLENLPIMRIKILQENGKVTGISRLYEDGTIMNDHRSNQ